MNGNLRMFSRSNLWRSSAACVLAGAAAALTHADFTNISSESITLGTGQVVVNIYAFFDNVGDRLLAIEDATVFTNAPSGFLQSAANPHWKPANQSSLTSPDSCVCIDSNASNFMIIAANTAGNASFLNYDAANGATDFSYIHGSAAGAGWTNANPTGSVGVADGGKVLVAHLVIGPGINECSGVWWASKVRYIRASDGTTVTADVPLMRRAVVAALPVCGHSTCTDCCTPNPFPIPTCSDFTCCQVVCPVDPYCCDSWWDTSCATMAVDLCGGCSPVCRSDLNHDGMVDGTDIGLLLGGWERPGITDLNEDLTTDGSDLGVLLGAWGACN